MRSASLALVVLALAGAASAQGKAPLEMGDLFLVEQNGKWMCPNESARTHVNCPTSHGSREAAQLLVDNLTRDPLAPKSRPLYLRVAKARNDCHEGRRAGRRCQVAVPSREDCSVGAMEGPYCALEALKQNGAKLGVVLSAAGEEGDSKATPRTVPELAWHACQVRRADGHRLYSFMFLDLTFKLKEDLRPAVRRIQRGQVRKGKRWVPCEPGKKGKKSGRGWRVITNDTTYPYGRSGATLDTGAWGHARHLDLLEGPRWRQRAKDAAEGRRAALTPSDLQFVHDVGKLKSHAVLRFEVPSQSSMFAKLGRPVQCSLLGKWARQQARWSYTFLYPLYVHGVGANRAYDSFGDAGTFPWQRELIDRYLPEGAANEVACPTQTTTGDPSKRPGDPRPRPMPRSPDVGGAQASEVTCKRARLNGWVNPHGSATTFSFEYWKRGVNVPHRTGAGDAGAGGDRVDVVRVVDDLQADTGYSAKLIASNAAGRAVSDVFSFTTAKGC